ncbi:MAG: sodium-translocating pyrophosphatase [Opitutales bacterium]
MSAIDPVFWLVPVTSVLALSFAIIFYKQMMGEDEGTDVMKRIAAHVRAGAIAYLRQQYKVVGLVFAVLTLLFCWLAYGLGVQNDWVPFAFLTGGFFSGLAGFFGMKTATQAAARSANAARNSLDHGLRVAFRSGAVMGLVVVGLALLDISAWFIVLNLLVDEPDSQQKMILITTTMLTFGMGASLQALFARVGGGIFTKAADVGADLVGKVEAGIPEDDPRNPATIADNVGDNVGDVAGMGADLYESYAGSILATASLGAAGYLAVEGADLTTQIKLVLAPMLIGALGTLLSIIGVYFVRVKPGAGSKQLLGALGKGINLSSALIVVVSLGILALLFEGTPVNYWGLWASIITGLITGIVIGKVTEYFTSEAYRPTQKIADQAETGPATVIIGGIGEGMLSTAFPVLAVVTGTALAFLFAADFDFRNMSLGLYGIGIAAVGMLSTLGITLATDAYGPIADNAGGNAEMSGLGPEVRKRTDALDSLGNTTAATGKGFAIGSAALTALALLAAYVEEIKIALARILERGGAFAFPNQTTIQALGEGEGYALTGGVSDRFIHDLHEISLMDMMGLFEVNLMNPKVIIGIFVGSMMAFLFCGLTMNAVGRAAAKMVGEVRRQFREIAGIMQGEAEPDYARCVEISTIAAQKEMLLPSMIAVAVPVIMGIIFGVPGVMGLLAGALGAGFVLAIFMANSGGAWDNAKKYIEQGHLGGKGSEAHKAAVIGDTVGDPFKDTSGPSLNILIKLMTMVSIVVAGVTISFHLF